MRTPATSLSDVWGRAPSQFATKLAVFERVFSVRSATRPGGLTIALR
jgi:hypothetical protein